MGLLFYLLLTPTELCVNINVLGEGFNMKIYVAGKITGLDNYKEIYEGKIIYDDEGDY